MSRFFSKHPNETYAVDLDYTEEAPPSATLSSGTWSASDENDGSDATATVLASTVATISGQTAAVQVQAGILDHVYKLELDATFDNGDVLHDNILMYVDDSG